MQLNDKVNDIGLGISDGYKDVEIVGLRRQPQKELAVKLEFTFMFLTLISFVFTMILIGGKSLADHEGYNSHVFAAGYGVAFFLLVATGAFYTDFSGYIPHYFFRGWGIQLNVFHGLAFYAFMTLVISCLMGHLLEVLRG